MSYEKIFGMLILPTHCYNAIIRDAIEKYPAECCGLLLGRENNEQRFITEVIACGNSTLHKEKEFIISSQDYLAAEKKADEKKWNVLGVYHSHPDKDAVPSAADARNALPNLSCLIVSVFKNKISTVRSWRPNDTFLLEEETILNNQNTIVKNNTVYGNHNYSDSFTQVHR